MPSWHDGSLELPRTRGDCISGPRPCPSTSCRYHLGESAGGESCALDVADRGPHSRRRLAPILGETPEQIWMTELRALRKVRAALSTIRVPSAPARPYKP
jgi:hypothetical protein